MTVARVPQIILKSLCGTCLLGSAYDDVAQMSKAVFKISVHHDLSGLIHDANPTVSGINIDADIVVGTNVTAMHKRAFYTISLHGLRHNPIFSLIPKLRSIIL